MKRFFLIANLAKDFVPETRAYIRECLEKRGAECRFLTLAQQNKYGKHTPSELVPEDTECVITIGGDGTLIQAARDLAGRNIPLLGVNRGHLGFLNQISSQDEIEEAVVSLIENRYELECRMMIRGTVFHQGKPVFQDIALNEIAVTSRVPLRVLRYQVSVNDEYLNHYSADGVLVATPTGSTAYNLSAGGPVMAPAGRMMALTPVCPHSLNARSIVLASEDRIRIGVSNSGRVSFDGDSWADLETGDFLIAERSGLETVMIRRKKQSFMQNLSDHLSGI